MRAGIQEDDGLIVEKKLVPIPVGLGVHLLDSGVTANRDRRGRWDRNLSRG